jgi:hypothetical protein
LAYTDGDFLCTITDDEEIMMESVETTWHGEVWFGLNRLGKRSSMMEGGRNQMARFGLA